MFNWNLKAQICPDDRLHTVIEQDLESFLKISHLLSFYAKGRKVWVPKQSWPLHMLLNVSGSCGHVSKLHSITLVSLRLKAASTQLTARMPLGSYATASGYPCRAECWSMFADKLLSTDGRSVIASTGSWHSWYWCHGACWLVTRKNDHADAESQHIGQLQAQICA